VPCARVAFWLVPDGIVLMAFSKLVRNWLDILARSTFR
jgi:hypothetical protein